ncbi:hypothetical protein RB195_006793 [Necator americanus]|uniref:Uncharacterized protein n=1 Tax=Necator americanus TaxID=51031 RepID=A0ABR1BUA8_NECAM
MYGSETWAAPSTVMEGLDCTERKLLRWLLGYFWSRVCHNEDLYAEIDVVYRRMTRGKHQHLAPPSKVAKVNLLRFFGHILRRPADRLLQRVLRSSGGGVRARVRAGRSHLAENGSSGLRRIWNSDEWIDCVQALAEDREGWAKLCSRTAHLGEDETVQGGIAEVCTAPLVGVSPDNELQYNVARRLFDAKDSMFPPGIQHQDIGSGMIFDNTGYSTYL